METSEEEQYNIVTGAALINAVIAVIISSARVDILTSNAFFGAALTFSAVAVIALAASVSIIVAIIATSVFMVVLIGLIITAEAGEKFALASLVIEGKIIFAVISAITFL